MTVDARMEDLYQQIELVRGAGDRKRGKLCVMSFVAFLAGESHSDNPATASTLIRRFAMTINDAMPDNLRQRLKAFAPRIVGTRDGQDRARVKVLIEAARSELLPQISADFGDPAAGEGRVPPMSRIHRGAVTLPELREQVVSIILYGSEPGNTQACEEIASALAHLISQCGRMADTPAQRDWYWLKAIELLDRLCDVGATKERPPVPDERVTAMGAYLEQRNELRAKTASTFARVRSLIPALIG